MKKIYILVLLLGTLPLFAQLTTSVSNQIPSGKYYPERESFQVYKAETAVQYQVDESIITIAFGVGVAVEYFTEIEATGNTIIFKSPTKTVQVNYNNDSLYGIVFNTPVEPFEKGVAEANDQLIFMKEIEDPNDHNDLVTVRFVYQLKK